MPSPSPGSRSENAWAAERVRRMAQARYAISILPSAVRQLEKLARPARRSVAAAIDTLATEPRPRSARRLAGTGSQLIWRVRVGDYRIVYQVDDARSVVIVVRVADRREAYRPADLKRLLARLRGGA